VGLRLLRLEGTVDQTSGVLQDTYFTSYGSSEYQALQTQFRGDITPNLYTLVSYSWGHSIDNGSQGSAVYLAQSGYPASSDRASSDFDIRHNLNASLSYRMPLRLSGGWQSWLNNWTLSSTLDARAGFPFNVTTVDRSIGLGFANTGRPNLLPGQPIWIPNSSVPGGQELNPNAFQTPATGWNGTLGRNILTGPGLFQIDVSVRRQFRVRPNLSRDEPQRLQSPESHQFCQSGGLFGKSFIRTAGVNAEPDDGLRESDERAGSHLPIRRSANSGDWGQDQLLILLNYGSTRAKND
jgi:hypothetical protein